MTSSNSMHLICSVGARPSYSDLTYRLEAEPDRTYRTRFAPAALANLFPLQGAKASVLVTEDAHRLWYEALASELKAAGLQVRPIPISEGRTEAEILGIFAQVVDLIGERERLVLDVTFAFRHLPFVYLAAMTYLTAYKQVTIDHIFYGAYELRDRITGIAPILDLTTLFDLTRWYHAIQSARQGGDLRQTAEMLRVELKRLAELRQIDRQLGTVKDRLNDLAPALAAGLPVEAGLCARDLGQALDALTDASGSAVVRLSLQPLSIWTRRWAVEQQHVSKQMLGLSGAELRRQHRLASWYAEQGELPKVLLILREWVVSFVILRRGNRQRWLAVEERRQAELALHAMQVRRSANVASDDERVVLEVWDGAAALRNQFAHVGMREHDVQVSADKVRPLLDGCARLLEGGALAQIALPATDRLLITPLGFSPGVVFTAIRLVQPSHLAVITSEQALTKLDEALAEAGARDLPCTIIKMDDPHAGLEEAKGIVNDELCRALVGAGEVVVNLTGGTTVMHYALECVAEQARRLGARRRRVLLIDRRPPEEQKVKPYVLAELIDLDEEGEASGDDTE